MAALIHSLPALKDNYIHLIEDTESKEVAAIDPSDAAPVIDWLVKEKKHLSLILCTHHHPDHVGGNLELKKRESCTVLCSEYDFNLSRVPGADRGINDWETTQIGKIRMQGIAIPGHTLGHMAFYCEKFSFLMSGDTLFALGAGRLFEGTASQLQASLRRIKETCTPQTKVFYGHEYALNNLLFTESLGVDDSLAEYGKSLRSQLQKTGRACPGELSKEFLFNPFYRIEQPGYKKLLKMDGLTDQEAFANLRKMRDKW